ncbi:MAG: protein kinase [Chloroflexota bacterium]
MSNLTQQQIDQFYITRLIAQGGMAEVYLAQDVNLKRQVALKVLSPQMAADDNANARFRREAEMVARLNHPHIVQIFSTGTTPDKRPFLAMEYVSGGSLQKYLAHLGAQQQRLTTVDALSLTRQVAAALAVAHQAGIVHRDLKPSNILLRPDGTPVVTDLGIAAVHTESRLTEIGTVVGTPHYMSPEQARGLKVDGRSDIYSLGIILYEMLAGVTPFSGDSPLSILNQQINEPPLLLEWVRDDLAAATRQTVEICLQKDPADRFQTAADLMAAVDHALAVERGERLPEPLLTPLEPETVVTKRADGGKRPLWPFALVAGVMVLALLCGLGYFVIRGLWAGIGGADSADLAAPPTLIVTRTAAAAAPATEPVSPLTTAAPIISSDVVAMRLTAPPVVDGDLAEWTGIAPYLSTHPVYTAPGWDGSEDIEAAWHIGWDADYLYVAVRVVDDVHVQTQTGNQIFKGDNVDLQLDVDRAGDWGSNLNADDYQINLSPGNFANMPPSAFRFAATADGRSIDAPGHGIQIAARQQPDGYTLEAAVPWRDLNVTPAAGLVLGAAFNVSDNDTPGTAVQEHFLSNVAGRKWSEPATWGTLTLSE